MPRPVNLVDLEITMQGGYFPSAPDIPRSDFLGTIRKGSNVWVRARGRIEVANGLNEVSSTNVGARIFAADIQRASIAGGLVGNRLPFAGLLRYRNAALFFLSENTSAQVYLNETAVTGFTTSSSAGRLRVAVPDGLGGFSTFDAGFEKQGTALLSIGVFVDVGHAPMVGTIGVSIARWRASTNAIGPPSDVVYEEVLPPTPGLGNSIGVTFDGPPMAGQDGWIFAGTRWDDRSGAIRVVRRVYWQPRGTFTVTNGSTTITGQNTFWTLDLRPGDIVNPDGNPVLSRTITAVISDTEATWSLVWAGSSGAGHTMNIPTARASWYDEDLQASVSRDVFKPPRAAGVLKYADRVFLWGVPDTTDVTYTSPTGASLVPMLDNNPEHVDPTRAIVTDSGSDLVNALAGEAAIFLMTTTGLEVVTFTGDPDTPYKVRVAAEPGFVAATNGVVDGDIFYGFNGAPLRTKAESNIDVEFGEPVLKITKTWNPERVMLAVDPKNRAVLYMHDNGSTTTVLPYMTQFGAWGPELNFSARILDTAVVNGELQVTYLSGGNIRVNEWEGGAGIGGDRYVASQYYDANALNRNRLKNLAFTGKAGTLRVYAAAPDAAVPDVGNPLAATASFALSDIDKSEPEIFTNIEGRAFAFRVDFASNDGNLDKLVARGLPRSERR